jgi:NADH dehydrogenase/NADH:ubiquinone oxidoreductase subunit G
VPKGTTVLKAAQKLGIYIPTLCYNEAASTYAACRICIVEMSIESRGKTYNWIDASCVYPVQDGLRVQTNSPKVRQERKLILELMLSKAPDAPVLNKLAKEYGADKNRFESIDKGESNCILCGLCVRVCDEMIQTSGIGTAYRGVHKKVLTPYKIARKICTGCAACSFVCPTGAIKVIDGDTFIKIDNWEAEIEKKKCVECGKPYAPAAYLEQIRRQVQLRDDIFDKCPACRRKMFVST